MAVVSDQWRIEMRKRKDLREAYERVMEKAWGEHDTGWKTRKQPVDIKLMRSAVKRIWRKLTGNPCPYPIVQTNRGGMRRTYNSDKKRYEILINPKQGWYYTVHDLGHYLYERVYPGGKPHCDKHLEMERISAEIVVQKYLTGLVSGSLSQQHDEEPGMK
jgi:hypothetical protein